jgi:GT2 family glycosyltransferase
MRDAIIIPFYNGDEYIEKCIDSIMENCHQNLKIYVINNSDRPTTVHSLLPRCDEIRIVDTNPRIGFSAANNIGAKLAISEGADTIISLNQDTILADDCLTHMISVFEANQDIAIVAPITYKHDFKNVDELFIKYYLSQCPELFYDALNGRPKQLYLVERVSGACFAMRAAVIKSCGYFDELYFMYQEDDDLCRRIRCCKKLICISPRAKIAHMHSNRIDNPDHSGKRYSWQRHSRAIYELKSFDAPLYYSVIKVFGYNSIDYLKAIFTMKFYRAIDYLIKDMGLLLKYKKISDARRFERDLKNEIFNK